MEAAPSVTPSTERPPTVLGELYALFLSNRFPVLLAYGLLILENLLRLAQPFLLGLAVNDLLRSSYTGLWWFLAGHGAHMGTQFARQMYDTRVYSRMYAQRVSNLICRQREAGFPTSRVAARAGLSRQFVTFVEKQIPQMVSALFSCFGAVLMLIYYDWRIVCACVATAIPVFILNANYSRKVKNVSRELHDRWENEVEIVEKAADEEVAAHYNHMTSCWVEDV